MGPNVINNCILITKMVPKYCVNLWVLLEYHIGSMKIRCHQAHVRSKTTCTGPSWVQNHTHAHHGSKCRNAHIRSKTAYTRPSWDQNFTRTHHRSSQTHNLCGPNKGRILSRKSSGPRIVTRAWPPQNWTKLYKTIVLLLYFHLSNTIGQRLLKKFKNTRISFWYQHSKHVGVGPGMGSNIHISVLFFLQKLAKNEHWAWVFLPSCRISGGQHSCSFWICRHVSLEPSVTEYFLLESSRYVLLS